MFCHLFLINIFLPNKLNMGEKWILFCTFYFPSFGVISTLFYETLQILTHVFVCFRIMSEDQINLFAANVKKKASKAASLSVIRRLLWLNRPLNRLAGFQRIRQQHVTTSSNMQADGIVIISKVSIRCGWICWSSIASALIRMRWMISNHVVWWLISPNKPSLWMCRQTRIWVTTTALSSQADRRHPLRRHPAQAAIEHWNPLWVHMWSLRSLMSLYLSSHLNKNSFFLSHRWIGITDIPVILFLPLRGANLPCKIVILDPFHTQDSINGGKYFLPICLEPKIALPSPQIKLHPFQNIVKIKKTKRKFLANLNTILFMSMNKLIKSLQSTLIHNGGIIRSTVTSRFFKGMLPNNPMIIRKNTNCPSGNIRLGLHQLYTR